MTLQVPQANTNKMQLINIVVLLAVATSSFALPSTNLERRVDCSCDCVARCEIICAGSIPAFCRDPCAIGQCKCSDGFQSCV